METRLLIGGKEVSANGGKTFDRVNPVTGEVATRAAACSTQDAARAADATFAAFAAWSETGPSARRALLNKAADALHARAAEFVSAMMDETASTSAWAHFNVMLAANMIREAAAMTTQISGVVVSSDKPGLWVMAVHQPAGVVLGIAPWNAPVILGVRAIAMPLACGNTVVLKASELCPRVHWLIGQAFRDAGFPDGVVNVITNAPEDAAAIVETLIDHPAIRRINFTGSTRVGRIIAQRAARHLKPALLELGGKAPLIVLEDADLDEAVKAAAFGAFMNQGQICMSTERIIAVGAIADEFVAKLAAKANQLVASDPREGRSPLGAVVDRGTAERAELLIEDAVAKGAKRVAGVAGSGVMMPACVVDRVTAEMRIYSEESFGPVVAVIRARDEADAIRMANDSEYGLSAAVFSRDIGRALKVAKRIQSGMCHINGPTVHDEAQMPFGGMKASGYGRFGGAAAIAEFTDLRVITISTEPGHFPI
jgi:acyl-CoA reductase-like NAD-dependent aldehyde dehydrogenase